MAGALHRLGSAATAGTRRAPGPAVLVTALVGVLLAVATVPATAASQTIVSDGPLTRIAISDRLNCAVDHEDDATGQFYSDTACGTFLAVDGTLFSPAEIPAGDAAEGTPFTPVSQSAVTGAGSGDDPLRIVTVVDLGGSGLRVTQTDSYVVGQESYRTDVAVENLGGATAEAILWRAGDCVVQGDDDGFGRADPDSGAVACVAPDPGDPTRPGDRVVQWQPLSVGSRYLEAHASEVWTRVGDLEPFDDSCECQVNQDNGAGLSWELSIPPGARVQRSHVTTFSPLGQVPLTTTKAADDTASEPGGRNGYTITVTNPNKTAAVLETIFDELPEGFDYVEGSTTGLTTEDPQVSGRRLTWQEPGSVPAEGATALHFAVEVFTAEGTFFNNAGASSPQFAVTPTGDSAPITIGDVRVAAEGPVDRVAGATRIETAVEVSKASFPVPGTDAVVLARADLYPDALAGAPLARLRDAPILLTTSDALHPRTRDEINRLGATNAILLGGEQALSAQVAEDLGMLTTVTDIERVAGPSRFHTAAQVASRVGGDQVYVADGFDLDPRDGWPDALASSALAAFQGRPILLADTESLPSATRDALRDLNIAFATIVGGVVAISEPVADAIRAEDVTVDRVFGETRYETARALADVAIDAGMSPARSYIASGENFPDALVSGPAVAKAEGILMLVHPADLDNSPPTRQYLEQFKSQIEAVSLLGGPAAVSIRVQQQIAAVLAE
ncbi:MAG: cell wall-binding repeat-containing protein [Actinomycetota bacterium]|nr:cell wall-binding repeat-containing protein [Actinomycetota bacterium]